MQKFFYCTENRLRFRSLSWMVTVPILGTDLHPNYIQFNQGIRVRIRNQWKNRLNVVPWYRNPSLSRDSNPTPAVEISHKVVKSRFYCTRVSTLDQTTFFVSWGETVQSVDIYVKAMFHLKMDICPRFLWERSHDLDIVNSYCGVAVLWGIIAYKNTHTYSRQELPLPPALARLFAAKAVLCRPLLVNDWRDMLRKINTMSFFFSNCISHPIYSFNTTTLVVYWFSYHEPGFNCRPQTKFGER